MNITHCDICRKELSSSHSRSFEIYTYNTNIDTFMGRIKKIFKSINREKGHISDTCDRCSDIILTSLENSISKIQDEK